MEVALTKVWLIGFVIGTILGSFVKALADRSFKNKSYWGRSYCPHCKKALDWYDLFPIISFIILGGRCRYCHKKIGSEYLLVEMTTGILVAFLFWQSLGSLQGAPEGAVYSFQLSVVIFNLIYNTFFIIVLGVVFLTDFKKMLIYDRIIYPAILIGFFSYFLFTVYKIGYLYYSLLQSRVGQLLLPPHSDYFQRHALITAQPFLGSLLMAVLIGSFFWGLIIITRGKGMGGGDVKLGAFMGLMLGFPHSLVALICAFVVGAIFSLVLIILGKKHFGQTIAFGPFLVAGSLIAMYWGQTIFDWYLNLGT